jgi:hypothetical protein
MTAIAPAHNWVIHVRRFVAPPVEHCEICNAVIPTEHRHLIDIVGRRMLCACRGCTATASRKDGPLRLPPRRVQALPRLRLTDTEWDALQIPIEMAFIFHSTPEGRPVALYPGPAGATESLLELEGWSRLTAANPVLAAMQSDVEALLVNRTQADRCYALVGTIRRQWRGVSGGNEVWEAISGFFERLREDSGKTAS